MQDSSQKDSGEGQLTFLFTVFKPEINLYLQKNSAVSDPSYLNDWTNIIPTMNTENIEDITHKGEFTFFGLDADSEYEVIIQSRNKEGWSDPSDIF